MPVPHSLMGNGRGDVLFTRMTVALAEKPLTIEAPQDVDPHLRVAQSDLVRQGAGAGSEDPDRLSLFVNAPVVLGVRRPIEFQARMAAGRQERVGLNAFADMAMREVEGQQAVVLRCRAATLTVAVITVLDPSRPIATPDDIAPPILFWSLAPQGGDATARAEVLDFLKALHETGELGVFNTDASERVAALEGEGATFDPDLALDWAFVRDIATLEEWADMVLPLPNVVEAEEVARIQEAASFVRARHVPTRLSGDIQAVVTAEVKDAEELVLEQDFGVRAFGYDVPLGTGRARLAVTVIDSRTDANDPSRLHATFRPTSSDEPVPFVLTPPLERVARRWTLTDDERPTDDAGEDLWEEHWAAGERMADRELRTGQGVRFTSEDAFFAWLADPEGDAAG